MLDRLGPLGVVGDGRQEGFTNLANADGQAGQFRGYPRNGFPRSAGCVEATRFH